MIKPEKTKQLKRQNATFHKHFLSVKLTPGHTMHLSYLSTAPITHTEHLSCQTTQMHSVQTTLRNRKELGKSQEKALWFSYMNLEMTVICTQTMEIQDVIIRQIFLESDKPFPLCFCSLFATNYYQEKPLMTDGGIITRREKAKFPEYFIKH